jgi:hypothetical protein
MIRDYIASISFVVKDKGYILVLFRIFKTQLFIIILEKYKKTRIEENILSYSCAGAFIETDLSEGVISD